MMVFCGKEQYCFSIFCSLSLSLLWFQFKCIHGNSVMQTFYCIRVMFAAHHKCLPFPFVELNIKMYTNIKVHASNWTQRVKGWLFYLPPKKNSNLKLTESLTCLYGKRVVSITFASEKHTGVFEYKRLWFDPNYQRISSHLGGYVKFILNYICSSQMFCSINSKDQRSYFLTYGQFLLFISLIFASVYEVERRHQGWSKCLTRKLYLYSSNLIWKCWKFRKIGCLKIKQHLWVCQL